MLHLDDRDRVLGAEWLFVHVVRNPLDTLAAIDEAAPRGSLPIEWDGQIALRRRYTDAGLAGEGRHPIAPSGSSTRGWWRIRQ